MLTGGINIPIERRGSEVQAIQRCAICGEMPKQPIAAKTPMQQDTRTVFLSEPDESVAGIGFAVGADESVMFSAVQSLLDIIANRQS